MILNYKMDSWIGLQNTSNNNKNRLIELSQNQKIPVLQTLISTSKNIFTSGKWKIKLPEWEKIFVNHISDKGLICTICKNSQLNKNKKTIQLIKKWAKDLNRCLNRCFSKEYVYIPNKHMKRTSTSLLIREM